MAIQWNAPTRWSTALMLIGLLASQGRSSVIVPRSADPGGESGVPARPSAWNLSAWNLRFDPASLFLREGRAVTQSLGSPATADSMIGGGAGHCVSTRGLQWIPFGTDRLTHLRDIGLFELIDRSGSHSNAANRGATHLALPASRSVATRPTPAAMGSRPLLLWASAVAALDLAAEATIWSASRRRSAGRLRLAHGRPTATSGGGDRMIDLGTLGGSTSKAADINDSRVAVGQAATSTGQEHAFRWDEATGRMQDLGTLGGRTSAARSVNNAGQIVGYAETSAGRKHAFLWGPAEGTLIDLGTLEGGESDAWDVNREGVVVGTSRTSADDQQAVWWSAPDRTIARLPSFGGSHSQARSVNDHLLAAGQATDSKGKPWAVVWDLAGGTLQRFPMEQWSDSLALAINSANRVIGYGHDDQGQLQAFVWDVDDDTVGVIGEPGNRVRATSISRSGNIVGDLTSSQNRPLAFVWSLDDDQPHVLGTLGGSWSRATGVNRFGNVVGTSLNGCCCPRAFLWIPCGIPASDSVAVGEAESPLAAEIVDPDTGFTGAGMFGGSSTLASGLGSTSAWGGPAFSSGLPTWGGSGGSSVGGGGGGGFGGGGFGGGGFGGGGTGGGGGVINGGGVGGGGGNVLGNAPEPASWCVWALTLLVMLGGHRWRARR